MPAGTPALAHTEIVPVIYEGRPDRQRLGKAHALLDGAHPAWALVHGDVRSRGQITYGVLCG